MANKVSANWNAVCNVYFKGQIMPKKERSCNFHWVQSMQRHRKSCIKAPFQAHRTLLNMQWKDVKLDIAAMNCR